MKRWKTQTGYKVRGGGRKYKQAKKKDTVSKIVGPTSDNITISTTTGGKAKKASWKKEKGIVTKRTQGVGEPSATTKHHEVFARGEGM